MKPVDQTIFDPHKGDCFRACLASVFEFPIEEMPNYWEQTNDAPTFWNMVNVWMESKFGYRCLPIASDETMLNVIKGLLCIAIGKTNREGEDHAVVWFNGLIHDPYPSREGLIEDPRVYVIFVPINEIFHKIYSQLP